MPLRLFLIVGLLFCSSLSYSKCPQLSENTTGVSQEAALSVAQLHQVRAEIEKNSFRDTALLIYAYDKILHFSSDSDLPKVVNQGYFNKLLKAFSNKKPSTPKPVTTEDYEKLLNDDYKLVRGLMLWAGVLGKGLWAPLEGDRRNQLAAEGIGLLCWKYWVEPAFYVSALLNSNGYRIIATNHFILRPTGDDKSPEENIRLMEAGREREAHFRKFIISVNGFGLGVTNVLAFWGGTKIFKYLVNFFQWLVGFSSMLQKVVYFRPMWAAGLVLVDDAMQTQVELKANNVELGNKFSELASEPGYFEGLKDGTRRRQLIEAYVQYTRWQQDKDNESLSTEQLQTTHALASGYLEMISKKCEFHKENLENLQNSTEVISEKDKDYIQALELLMPIILTTKTCPLAG